MYQLTRPLCFILLPLCALSCAVKPAAQRPIAVANETESSLANAPVHATTTKSDLAGWTLKEKIGQLLIIGYRDQQQLEEIKPGGVAFFSWSMKSVEQTRELTARLREFGERRMKAPLMMATDHEGGRVIRLRNGMTGFPEASAIGASDNEGLSRRVGVAVGKELAYLGIHANFAPVLDIGGSESFLGNRLWGNNAESVAKLTGAYIQGMQEAGVMSVAKHFPGHGTSADDAHFSLPVNEKKLRTLWSEDFKPFQHAVIEKVPAMMTAHVRVPEVDRLPASMSPRFLSRILRDTFRFEGVIITDDLEMRGAQNSTLTAGDTALQALMAGSDMLLIVWSKVDQKNIIKRIENAVRSGEWSEDELNRRVNRILSMKAKWIGNAQWRNANAAASPLRSLAHLRLVDEINRAPVAWKGMDRQILTDRWREAWQVVVPNARYLQYWKGRRPQDKVTIVERRSSRGALDLAQKRFSTQACQSQICVALTEEAAQTSPVFFRHLEASIQNDGPQSGASNAGALVWAHMGLEPKLKTLRPGAGFALLGASGTPRLQRFLSDVAPQNRALATGGGL